MLELHMGPLREKISRSAAVEGVVVVEVEAVVAQVAVTPEAPEAPEGMAAQAAALSGSTRSVTSGSRGPAMSTAQAVERVMLVELGGMVVRD